MLHFYDGQIRKFLTQFMRVLSNFSIEVGKGSSGEVTLKQVPVVYGDLTRQVANILKNNSENALLYAPKIACYINGLSYDRERMQNPYHIEKQHLRERNYNSDTSQYDEKLGAGYTIEKVMPSPFRLNVRADIFTTNTDMKLQILEQILYLFNPDFEIQKSDNYIDWTSLSYIELQPDITFSSRTIPVGADTEIDVASLSFSMPIWLSPPVKVSKLGVIQKIIMSIYDDDGGIRKGLIDGDLLSKSYITPNNFSLLLTGNQLRLLGSTGINVSSGSDGYYTGATAKEIDPFTTFGPPVNWNTLLNQYGKITGGLSQIKLTQENGNEVVGTIALSPLDESILLFSIDSDTIPANTLTAVSKIINPLTFDPGTPTDGTRYLIVNDIGDSTNTFDATAWGNLRASVNDIIQYNASTGKWGVVWDASNPDSTVAYVTNLNTGIQYKFTNGSWTKSYEGIYIGGKWTLVL